MYLFIVLFFNCYLLTNSALATSARKSFRKHNTLTDYLPNDLDATDQPQPNATVPKNCKFCLNKDTDTDCMEFDSDRCEYNNKMRIIADSDRMDDKFDVGYGGNGPGKNDVDKIFNDMMLKAATDESFKECIPFVSLYSDCYAENFCTGCSVCTCSGSGQWNCMMTQKCQPQQQLFIDHQVLTVLIENLGTDESDAENEGHFLDPSVIEANEHSSDEKRSNYKREISHDTINNMLFNDTKNNSTQNNDAASNKNDADNFNFKKELLTVTTIRIPLNNTQENITEINKALNNEDKYYYSNNQETTSDPRIKIPFNDTNNDITQANGTAVYSDDDSYYSYNKNLLVSTTNSTFLNNYHDDKTQNKSTAVNSDDKSHYSYKREISTDSTVSTSLSITDDNIKQSNDTNPNAAANNNQNFTNEENNYNTSITESSLASSQTYSNNKGIADENVEDIKEFVLYPISEIVKEKETELNELVTIKDNLLNLLALCKKFFDANNGSRSNLSVQDNSQAFMSLYNSKILPEIKKEISDRDDLDDIRNEDKLKDDLEVLMKDIIYMQKHNFETLPDDMKSVIRGLKYYSLEFMKFDQQHRLDDKSNSKINSYPQYRPKHKNRKINCYVLKALYNIFETLNRSNNTNVAFKSVPATSKKVLKRIINVNYHIHSPVNIKPIIENENIIMTALLNIESVCIKYLNEHKSNNSELYKLKNINFFFAQNIAALSDIISIIDLPRFEDYNLSQLFGYRLQILADRIVELLFKLKMRKTVYNDLNTEETTPMSKVIIKTYVNKPVVTRKNPQENLETIIEETETVTVPLSSITGVTDLPNVNNTVSLNPLAKILEFLKKAKNEVTKFVQNQLDKIKNQRNKQTQKLKEKEKHFEEVMKKWQKKLGLTHKVKRSLKDVDKSISKAVSNMFSSIVNVFAAQTHKLPTIKKTK